MGNESLISKISAPGAKKKQAADDEALLKLFWNRAELKKEFANLRDDRHQLVEKLKDQEAATRRVMEQLGRLENLLAIPESGFNAIVYYQLRALWRACRAQLQKFAGELKKQQEDRERKKQVMQFNQERQERLKELNESIAKIKEESDDMRAVVAALEEKSASLGGFWNIFKRRRLAQKIAEHRIEHDAIRTRLEELFDRRIKIESEQWPDFPGLSMEGKRLINIAIIALAQHLYVHFTEDSLSSLAKTATVRQVQDIQYGSREHCDYLSKKIKSTLAAMPQALEQAEDLKVRTNKLRAAAKYRADKDSVPMAESFPTTAVEVRDEKLRKTIGGVPLELNILAEEFWDLYEVLLR